MKSELLGAQSSSSGSDGNVAAASSTAADQQSPFVSDALVTAGDYAQSAYAASYYSS